MGCFSGVKVLLFIFNTLFWLAGATILAVGIILVIFFQDYVKAHDDLERYYYGTYAIIGAGSFLTLVGFFGCYGTCRESPCMLGTFFVLLFMIIIVEVAGCIYAYANKDNVRIMLEKSLQQTIKTEYRQTNDAKTVAIDIMQKELKCCGSTSYKDYQDIRYSGSSLLDIGVQAAGFFTVPTSCCVDPEESISCQAATKITVMHIVANVFGKIYIEGCSKKIWDFYDRNSIIVQTVALTIISVQVLAMMLSICLCCSLMRNRRYKS